MPKPHQIHPSTHLQDILSARRVRAKTISSSIAPSAPSTPTKEVREETPPEHMPVLRSRRHMRRSAGRPRLEATGEAILSEYRRDQIRRAQRTYRLKKEATLEKAKEHAANLEDRLNRTAAAIDEYKASIPPDLRNSHPALLGHLDCMADLTNLDCEPVTQLAPQGSNRYSFTSEKHILPSQQNAMSNGQLAAGDDIVTLPEPSKSCIIDIEQFLSRLLRGVVILGRAPAFRRTDVTNAFKSALRVQIRWLDNEFLHSMV
uniref:Uncharacterized protein n=1 Tax=Talaromyces marneffei PM1 TaxID=1077442 RepID=A0A093XH88_TALMA